MVVPRVSNRLAACWYERNYALDKGYIGVIQGLYGYMGIWENKMETTV